MRKLKIADKVLLTLHLSAIFILYMDLHNLGTNISHSN